MANKFTVILWGCFAYTVAVLAADAADAAEADVTDGSAESASVSGFDCNLFDTAEAALDGGLSLVNSFVQSSQAQNAEVIFDRECINKAVKRNYLEATEIMIEEYFSKDPQRASQAESTARNAIDQVRNRQNDFLSKFEQTPKSIPTISPAFNWAQSLDHAYLEVKYSTRFDSPACLDIFDSEFAIENEGKHLYLKAMCRNDKKLLKYELRLDLLEPVSVEDSIVEESSVGRVFVTLAKVQEPARWKRLLADNSQKPQNMGVWWELWEKYEKDLEEFDPDNGDEEEDDNDDVVVIGGASDEDATEGKKATSKRSKNKNRKKEKKAKKDQQEQQERSGEFQATEEL